MKYVHIAGTNGKGSVAEYLYRIIMAAGKRGGCFTSPHLISPAERLRADGRCITEAKLNALLDEARQKKLPVNTSLFAAQTAAALLWFERQGVEYAVLETGLGGRLDPTNYVQPVLSVLTAIDYDHMGVLGKSLEEIAYEKSGIIKPGVPVVCALQHPDVAAVVTAHCTKAASPLTLLPPYRLLRATLDGQDFEAGGETYTISALGAHQVQNAALAALAALKLGIEQDAVRAGLEGTRIRCRTQYQKGAPDMLIDGAHNCASVDALAGVLTQYFPDRSKVLLFACMADKDYAAMIERLAPFFKRVFVTCVDAVRGADASALCTLFSHHAVCEAVSDPVAAFFAAKQAAAQEEAMLVAAGSFYLAGRILPLIPDGNICG